MTSPIPAPFKYNGTAKGLMMWAASELEHVGRIISIEDPNIQYSYALSTVNGMAHLKDALFEYISDHPESHMKSDLLVFHEKVIRVMKHLIKDFDLDLTTIEAFNTRGTLSTLNYLKEDNNSNTIVPNSSKQVNNNNNKAFNNSNSPSIPNYRETNNKNGGSRKSKQSRKSKKSRSTRKNRKMYY